MGREGSHGKRGAWRALAVLLSGLPLLLTPAGLGAQEPAEASIPDADVQVAQALHAAPEGLRAGAAVRGFDEEGRIVTLREGAGELVCRADDPRDERFEVICYHPSLEPYLERGRELRAEGIGGREVDEIRWAEAEAGVLPLPDPTITLHILTGDGYDPAADEVRNPFLRWVIYVPYATAESTGLTTEPARGVPWLMYPGTPGAHIMITPEG